MIICVCSVSKLKCRYISSSQCRLASDMMSVLYVNWLLGDSSLWAEHLYQLVFNGHDFLKFRRLDIFF